MKKLLLAFILVPFVTHASHAASVRVADGDTIELGGQRIRLQGIDAPELHQECRDAVGAQLALRPARAVRIAQADRKRSPCNASIARKDRFGRSVAVCRAGGRDLGEAMVRSGWALRLSRLGESLRRRAIGRAQPQGRNMGGHVRKSARLARRASERRWPPSAVGCHAGDIIPAAAQDWLREHSQAARQSVAQWWRSLWTGKARKPDRVLT